MGFRDISGWISLGNRCLERGKRNLTVSVEPLMKRSPDASRVSARASKRANALIEAMLREMQRGLRQPELLDGPQWERVFGAKQSMVVNLQKLVQALSALPVPEPATPKGASKNQPVQTLSAEEMRLLTAWLADGET